jgi:hypothetical protein
MSSTKEIYWVCRQPSADVWQKIHLLQKYHISVRILPDFAALLRNYAETRLNTIVIGDEDEDAAIEAPMTRLSNHPEYSGVRFILSLSKASPALVKKAVDLGFRDIIPVDLPEAQWLRRYAFASSGRPTELNAAHPQMSMQGIASIQIPGRLAWITDRELWLETRLTPPVGTELTLTGGLADFLDVKSVRLKVLNRYRSHLHFRYSEALLCRWDVSVVHQRKKNLIQNFMTAQGSDAHYRFYAIIRNRDIRNAIVKKLPQDRFQLTVALNKNNMIQEPRYISPDAILIEDKMCLGAHQPNFIEMLKNLDTQIPVFVLGEAAKQVVTDTGHRLIAVPTAPPDYAAYFEETLGQPKAVNLDATQIPKNHPLSFGNINLPARILSIHPDAVEIASNMPLGKFGLFGLDAPLFQTAVQQKVHGKVLDSWEGDNPSGMKDFPYHARAILVDLTRTEREKLAGQLVELFTQQLIPKDQEPLSIRQAVRDLVREPVKEVVRSDEPDFSPAAMMMPEVHGAGPMRTEVSRPLRDMIDSSGPAAHLTSLETEVRPLKDQIVIDRNYKESSVADAFESVVQSILNIPKEVKIFLLVAVGIGLALLGATYARIPLEKQGGSFTDQLKNFQEMHDGRHKPEAREPTSDEPQ